MFCTVFCKEFLSFPLLVKTVIRIPKTMYYLQSNKTSNLLYHLTEQKKTRNCHKQLSSYQTHTQHLCTSHLPLAFRLISAEYTHSLVTYFVSISFYPVFVFSLFAIPFGSSPSYQTPGGLFQNFAHLNAVCPLFYQNARQTWCLHSCLSCTPASPHAHIEPFLYFFCTNMQQQAFRKQFCISSFK